MRTSGGYGSSPGSVAGRSARSITSRSRSGVNEMAESGLSPRTLRWVHSVLKMCLDDASDSGQLLGRNPAARTKFPPLRPTTHTYLTTAEGAALTLVCGRQGDVVSLLAYTGMRFGELTGLNVEDIDLKARRNRVRRSITQVGGKLVEGNPKSSAGRRSIPIPNASSRSSRPGWPGAGRASRRSPPPWAPGSGWRTGSGQSNGARPSSRLAARPYVCTIFGTPTLPWRAGPAPICGCCRRPWATRRSP